MHPLRAALLPLLGSLFLDFAAHGASTTLTTAQVDVDGDGRADLVTVSIDGRVSVRRSTGLTDALSFGSLPSLSRAFVEVLPGLGGSRYLRVEGHPKSGGKQLLLALSRGGRLDEVYSGPIGPVGRDAEYAVEVQLVGGELLRYQTSPSVRRCDGETRLFVERYVDPKGWQPAPEVTLPTTASAPALRTTPTAPQDLSGPPLGIYRYAGASAQGLIQRADMLAPPRELDDGSRATAWRVPRDGRGAFVTAQADGTGHSVRGLRIEAAPAGQGALPRRLALIFESKSVVDVELQPGGAVQWLQLSEPVATRCLSVVVREGAPGSAYTALGELSIYSELDGTAGLPALVERVAGGDSSDAEGALRTLRTVLARRPPPPGFKLLDSVSALLPAARGDGRRRLVELLLDAATQSPPAEGEGSGQLAELLAQGVSQLPAASQSAILPRLTGAGSAGRKALESLAGSESLPKQLRADAMARLGEAGPGVAVPALLRLGPSLAATPFLARALSTGLAMSLHCRPGGDPAVAAVEKRLDESLHSASELALAATLIQATAQAQAGCPDAAVRGARADSLAADWPTATAENFLIRYRLLQGLERLATESAASVALLQKVLSEESEPVLRQVAGRALAALPSRQLGGLQDRDAGVRLATLAALEGAMARQPEPALVAVIEERLTGDSWPTVRRVAAEVRAAACAASPGASAGLRKALADADEQVQRSAMVGVARCEGAGSVELLAPIAESNRSGAAGRGLACSLLARQGFSATAAATRTRARKAATAALLDLLQDPGADERHAAALTQCLRGFGEAGDASDVPALMDVAGSEVPAQLRQAALQSIGSICGHGPLLPSTRKGLAALTKSAAADPDKQLQRTAQRVAATCK